MNTIIIKRVLFFFGLSFIFVHCSTLPKQHSQNQKQLKIAGYKLIKLEVKNSKEGLGDEAYQEDEFDDEFEEYEMSEGFEVYDPWEKYNRAMFRFNDFVFIYGINPIAKTNAFILPKTMRIGMRNFFNNLSMPVRFLASLIQGKFKKAGQEFSHFLIDSTLGMGGLFDASGDWFDLRVSPEDFGQAFAAWGIPAGPYFVIPFLGSSNIRDAFGFVADSFTSTHGWIIQLVLIPDDYLLSLGTNFSIFVYKGVNSISLRPGEYEDLKKNAIDPYVLFKNVYEQYRNKLIKE